MSTAIENTESIEQAESAMRSKRHAIRLRIAKAQQRLDKIAELQSLAADADRQIDAAADEHAQATAPIQAELKLLERNELDRIVSKAGVDEQAEARRRELLVQLHDTNAKLETTLERLRRGKALLVSEITTMARDLSSGDSPVRLEAELIACAPERMRLALFVAERSLELARSRHDYARDQVARWDNQAAIERQRRSRNARHVGDPTGWNELGAPGQDANQSTQGDARTIAWQAARWSAELEAAIGLLSRASLEHDACRQQMIDVD